MKDYCENIPRRYPRNHFPNRQRLNKKNERHYRQNIMMRRKRREPMYGEIMYPHYQNKDIYRQYPKHEEEDGVGVVVEIMMGPGLLDLLLVFFSTRDTLLDRKE